MAGGPTNPSLRLFFALWPDPGVRNALAALQTRIRGRLVHPADLHLTLAFLGQQPESLLPALKEVLVHLPPTEFALRLDRAGYFARNRIAWAGMHEMPPALHKLHIQLKTELGLRGMDLNEERDYRPHVTLARDAEVPGDLVFEPIEWRAHEVALVRSDAQASGAKYRVIASRRLDEILRLPDPDQDAPLVHSGRA